MIPKVVLLQLGDRSFALELDGIWHILLTPRIFPLVDIRSGFRGIFLHQGELLPLLDLPEVLDVAEKGHNPFPPYTVVYGTDHGPLGLPVGQVLQIVSRDQGSSGPLPPELVQPYWQNGFTCRGQVYPLLDIESLLTSLPR